MSEPIEVLVQIAGADVSAGRMWSHGQGRSESATFAYADSYLAGRDSYELDPLLPLVSGQQHTPVGRALFGAFTDCAPDGWGRRLILRAQKAQLGRQPSGHSEIDFLLGTRDDMRQGALRFRHPGHERFLAPATAKIPPLVRLGRLLDASVSLERNEASDEDLQLLLRAGSSLGGARPKAQVLDNSGRLAIAKFPRVQGDDWDVIRWEATVHQLAITAGIGVPPARLEQIDGKPVLLVERFDRAAEMRIGYVSAMTRLERADGQQGDYLEIAAVTERTHDLHELWRRIAFSLLVSNTDDHLRNHGFLRLTTDGWHLSPAFDINPNPQARRFATMINADDTGEIDNLLGVAEHFRLSAADAVAVLGDVVQATSKWAQFARQNGISDAEIRLMADAFEHEPARQAASACRT
ncbi:MAG: type II toxin-antitoxin system HipA family toxin [Solirubrobacteraceae bacterium]